MSLKKWGKMIGLMLIGAVVGAGATTLLEFLGRSEISRLIEELEGLYIHNLIWIQLAAVILLLVPAERKKHTIKKMIVQSHLQEEDEDFEDELDNQMNKMLFLNSAFTISFFMILGLGLNSNGGMVLASTVIFLIFIMRASVNEIGIISQIKQRDPLKKGDPTSFKFDKDWVASCDEAEQFIIYKNAYKTFSLMKYLLMATHIATWLFVLVFDHSKLLIILTGGLWMVHTLSYNWYAIKTKE